MKEYIHGISLFQTLFLKWSPPPYGGRAPEAHTKGVMGTFGFMNIYSKGSGGLSECCGRNNNLNLNLKLCMCLVLSGRVCGIS